LQVFSTKMKNFERQVLNKRNEEEIKAAEEKISSALTDVFKPPPTKEKNKDLVKQALTIDLLSDSKISDIKGILA